MPKVRSLGIQGAGTRPEAAYEQLRAAAYARVSTAMEIQEHSLETQMEYFRKRIKSDSRLTLVDIYGDQASGRDIQGRDEFQRMLADCRSGKIDIIYTKSISRFGRDVADVLETLRELKSLNIRVIFEKENLDTGNRQSELLFGILATVAQEESRSISENMRWSRIESLKKGKPYSKPPYGYTMNKANHIWRVNTQEAKRVKRAFQMALEEHTYMEIRAQLNRMEEEEDTGIHWTQYRLRYLLTNPLYTGTYISDRMVTIIDPEKGKRTVKNTGQKGQYILEGHHAPLVGKDDFKKVQGLVEGHKLFSHKVKDMEKGE